MEGGMKAAEGVSLAMLGGLVAMLECAVVCFYHIC